MSPGYLALRQLLLGPARVRWAVLLVAAALSALDLFAGHVAGERSRLEYQAVVGERLGHLSIRPAGPRGFDPATAERAAQAARRLRGVALVVPQLTVAGLAASGARTSLFVGEGIIPAYSDRLPLSVDLPGRVEPPRGIAMSKPQADMLGVAAGSELTLSPLTAGPALSAQLVEVFGNASLNPDARSVLMPFRMAQELAAGGSVGRLVVYLANPAELDAVRAGLEAELQRLGMNAVVSSWRELSAPYASARRGADFALACMAAAVFSIAAVVLICTLTLDGMERRREMATLQAIGMRPAGLVIHIVAQALWMAATAAALSMLASSVVAWTVNRIVMSATPQPGLARPEVMVELDFGRMGMAIGMLAAVALVAAFAPAIRAARADLARALAGVGRCGW
ncbi:MAG TPA: FtsX-like permease family protein [Telluria sp.]|nr:FtsX-like permease family protein [Telluria sp.]